MKTLTVISALLFMALPALAQDADIESMPGYVDFGALSADYGEPRVMVDLGGSLLKLVSAMKHDDPVAEQALRSIDSVRVNVYDTAGDSTPAEERMSSVSKSLTALSWEQIVRVREEDKQVDIYVKHGDDRVHGLTVMSVDSEQAVFINVLGDIDPGTLRTVVDHVDLDVDIDL
ncbi:MAG: hypothetical protein ACI87W_000209 [Halieaceae bacterium]|jgi:hypothetical protein